MTIALPYWWSQRCYDIVNDEVRGGWRCLWFRLTLFRGFQVFNPINPRWMLQLTLECGRGAIFPKERRHG